MPWTALCEPVDTSSLTKFDFNMQRECRLIIQYSLWKWQSENYPFTCCQSQFHLIITEGEQTENSFRMFERSFFLPISRSPFHPVFFLLYFFKLTVNKRTLKVVGDFTKSFHFKYLNIIHFTCLTF